MITKTLLTLAAVSGVALAQNPTTINFERIERPWLVPQAGHTIPGGATYVGTDSDLICGAFVPGHDGRSALIIRGGIAYMSFQPASFEHLVPVAMPNGATLVPGSHKIGTLQQIDGGADRVAALTTEGLAIWRLDADHGFVQVAAQGPDDSFAGARKIVTGVHNVASGPENHVLALGPGWVRGGVIMPNDQLLAGPQIDFPQNVDILDATPISWTSADLPEFAVLTTTGMFVLDIAGNVIDSLAGTATEGCFCFMRQAGVPALCAVVDVGNQWVLHSWPSDGSAVATSPLFAMPSAPTGIRAADLDGDNYPEVVVSAQDSIRRVFFGTANGPTLQGRLDVHDVDSNGTATLPMNNDVPLVVDDIDLNGNPDFIVQSSATNQLIVMLDALPQTMLQAFALETTGDELKGLAPPEFLGQSQDALPWAATGTQRDLFGMRFAIPDWVPDGMTLQIFAYPSDGTSFSPKAIANFHFALPSGAATHEFDVLVPVARHSVLGNGESHRYVFESRLIDLQGNSPIKATKPTLCQYDAYYTMPTTEQFVADLNGSYTATWTIDWLTLSLGSWNSGQFVVAGFPFDPDEGLPSRYIGTVVPVGSMPADIELPKSIPPTPLSNGKLRL